MPEQYHLIFDDPHPVIANPSSQEDIKYSWVDQHFEADNDQAAVRLAQGFLSIGGVRLSSGGGRDTIVGRRAIVLYRRVPLPKPGDNASA